MKICATMIVKNEAHVIARCLESVLPLVDYVCICDTGSTDDTTGQVKQVMRKFGRIRLPDGNILHKAYALYHHDWENFGANRTKAFRTAEKHFSLTPEDWHLVIDADDALQIGCLEDVLMNLESTHCESWELEVEHPPSRYHRLHFFRADGNWRYVGPAHEYPSRGEGLPPNKGTFSPEVIRYRFLGGGATYLVPQAEKYASHAELFRETLAANPEDTRSAFYLAQSLKDAGQIPEAIQAYLKRASMGGWDQERYYSLLQAGRLSRSRSLACEGILQRAHLLDPTRAEAPYELSSTVLAYHDQDPHGENARDYLVSAYQWAEVAATRPEPSKDHLFVEPDVWMWSRNLAAQLRGKLCSYG